MTGRPEPEPHADQPILYCESMAARGAMASPNGGDVRSTGPTLSHVGRLPYGDPFMVRVDMTVTSIQWLRCSSGSCMTSSVRKPVVSWTWCALVDASSAKEALRKPNRSAAVSTAAISCGP
jgi:hypothetical protein